MPMEMIVLLFSLLTSTTNVHVSDFENTLSNEIVRFSHVLSLPGTHLRIFLPLWQCCLLFRVVASSCREKSLEWELRNISPRFPRSDNLTISLTLLKCMQSLSVQHLLSFPQHGVHFSSLIIHAVPSHPWLSFLTKLVLVVPFFSGRLFTKTPSVKTRRTFLFIIIVV